jgi:hypothetical protein
VTAARRSHDPSEGEISDHPSRPAGDSPEGVAGRPSSGHHAERSEEMARPVNDLDTALDELDRICAIARTEHSMMGVFPAMYRQVTRSIHSAVRTGGCFDDDERLERMAADFAARYVTAFDDHRAGRSISRSWRIAFAAAESSRRHMIVQHLLLGMNAHINFDLGISTAETGLEHVHRMEADFLRVNEVLFTLVDSLQGALGEVSPRMSTLDRWGGSWDERLMRIGIRRARSMAWPFAVAVATAADPTTRLLTIQERDEDTELLGKFIVRRWSPLQLTSRFVAAAETDDVGAIIDALEQVEVDAFAVTTPPPEVLERDPRPLRDELPRRLRRTRS